MNIIIATAASALIIIVPSPKRDENPSRVYSVPEGYGRTDHGTMPNYGPHPEGFCELAKSAGPRVSNERLCHAPAPELR